MVLQGNPPDTLVDSTLARFQQGIPAEASPLPGGVSAVMRVIFNAPLWAWLTAIVVGLVVAVMVVRLAWTNRVRLRGWVTTRDRGARFAMLGALVVVLGLVGFTGLSGWNYMQHDNDFCVSCHVMQGPWNKFAADAGKHSDRKCHDCHQQSLYASARQLVLWVADRPQDIPKHAPVPNARCESCHNTNGDSLWTRIEETAGHRTHLESDSLKAQGITCVTCHGAEVHEFLPASRTCGQSGCHEDLHITLGKMASQTTLHCNQCHQFTAEVPRLATRDSAAGTLRPGSQQCFACHQMRERLPDFDLSRDPHGGTCGTCHNPHTQDRPEDAAKTCTDAGCHADWRNVFFHTGPAHRKQGENCLTCHAPHAAKVDASDCVGCHSAVRERGIRQLRPPMPFDTTAALRQVSARPAAHQPPTGAAVLDPVAPVEPPPRGKGDAPPPDERPPSATHVPASVQVPPADSFPHARHRSLACITCHVSPGSQSGRLTFERPRGCDICHHQAAATNKCERCHRTDRLAVPMDATVQVTVAGHAPRSRPVVFRHPTHDSLACTECHTTAVSLEPSAATKGCTACHASHHTANRQCAACHTGESLRTAHAADVRASHQRCDACHAPATVALLTPDRSFCATCHAAQRADHYSAKQCTTCHFLADPSDYRSHLVGGKG